MALLSHDTVVSLKYVLSHDKNPTYQSIATDLGMTPSNVYASVRRAVQAKLLEQRDRRSIRPILNNIEDFLVHGVRYAFYAEHGPPIRGIPTAHAALPLSQDIASDPMPPVWPDVNGTAYGPALVPLLKTAAIATQDPRMYQFLALVDALRDGKARERRLAQMYLHKRLEGDWS
jgi:hypothetical protein